METSAEVHHNSRNNCLGPFFRIAKRVRRNQSNGREHNQKEAIELCNQLGDHAQLLLNILKAKEDPPKLGA